MINRDNYLAVKAFLDYQAQVMQRDPLTIKTDWGWLKHLLRWADETPFVKVAKIRPVFPQYLLSVTRGDGTDAPLTPLGVKRACHYARMFFSWLQTFRFREYHKIDPAWIETIHPPRMPTVLRKEREVITLDVARRLVSLEAEPSDLATRRESCGCFPLSIWHARYSLLYIAHPLRQSCR
jgi:hypothetical protein